MAKTTDDDNEFANAERYSEHLRDGLHKAKQQSMHFAFGAGTRPTDHRMALHRSTSPNALASKLRQQTSLKKLTWGTASSDPARAQTLVLALDGPVMTGLNTKYKQLRKQFGPLFFDRVKVLVRGVEIVDEPDPTDVIDPADAADGEAPVPRTLAAEGSALATWQTARSHAVEQLRRLGAAIRAAKDPDMGEAEIRLQSVIRQLTAAPTTPQQVVELDRYLRTDDVFDDLATPNPFGLDLQLRAPLLQALAAFQR